MYFICDDICSEYYDQLYKLEKLKEQYSQFKVICFVIAKDLTFELKKWLSQDWIEVGVHGYSHEGIPECERKDKEERIKKSFSILKPLLPKKYGFRAPGFQITATTYPILRSLGFWYIAHQTRIQPLKLTSNAFFSELLNTHIYDPLEFNFGKNSHFKHIYEDIQ